MVAKTRSKGSAGAPGLHEVARLFPPMTQAEFEALKEDIGRHGLREPITTSEGEIVDGIHRDRACRELGIEPRYVEWSGEGSLVDFVVGRNLHRRHLTESQRAMVAARIANLAGGRPAKTARKEAVSEAEAAARMKVGRSSVQKAKQVLGRGDPGLVAAVERDEVSVSAAARVAELGREEQAEVVARGPAAIKARARQARRGEGAKARRRAQAVHDGDGADAEPVDVERSTSSGSTPSRPVPRARRATGRGWRACRCGPGSGTRPPSIARRWAGGGSSPCWTGPAASTPASTGRCGSRVFSLLLTPPVAEPRGRPGPSPRLAGLPRVPGHGGRRPGRALRVVPGRRVLHHAGRRGLIAPAVGPIHGVGPRDGLVNRPDGVGPPDGRLGRDATGTTGSGGVVEEGRIRPAERPPRSRSTSLAVEPVQARGGPSRAPVDVPVAGRRPRAGRACR